MNLIIQRVFLYFVLTLCHLNAETNCTKPESTLATSTSSSQDHADKIFQEGPDAQNDLEKIESLDLSNKKLVCFPSQLFLCPNLSHLYLGFNDLETTPRIGELSNLTFLNLSLNPLKELPENIGNLKQLKELQVTGTNITELPKSLINCDSLKILVIYDNDNLKKIDENLVKKLDQLWVSLNLLNEETRKFLLDWNDKSNIWLIDPSSTNGTKALPKNPKK